MRNYINLILLLFSISIYGCSSQQKAITTPDDRAKNVNKHVVVIGEVTQTKCPTVCGIDTWALENQRGTRVRLTGTLRVTVIKYNDIPRDQQGRPMIATRGPGTFYHIENMQWEPAPDA